MQRVETSVFDGTPGPHRSVRTLQRFFDVLQIGEDGVDLLDVSCAQHVAALGGPVDVSGLTLPENLDGKTQSHGLATQKVARNPRPPEEIGSFIERHGPLFF